MTQEPNLPIKASWTEGARGKVRIILYTFNCWMWLKCNTNGKGYFHCSRKNDLSCPVVVTLDMEADMIVRYVGEQNHDSDLVNEEVRKLDAMKLAAAFSNPTVTPRTVFSYITKEVMNNPSSSSGIAMLPIMQSVARAVQRKRKEELDCLPVPKNWEDIFVPEYLKQTYSGD